MQEANYYVTRDNANTIAYEFESEDAARERTRILNKLDETPDDYRTIKAE